MIEFDCGDVLQRWVDALSDHISYGANLCASSDQLKDTDEVLSVGDLRQILQVSYVDGGLLLLVCHTVCTCVLLNKCCDVLNWCLLGCLKWVSSWLF